MEEEGNRANSLANITINCRQCWRVNAENKEVGVIAMLLVEVEQNIVVLSDFFLAETIFEISSATLQVTSHLDTTRRAGSAEIAFNGLCMADLLPLGVNTPWCQKVYCTSPKAQRR